jgi:hypothetical protein
MNKRPGHVVVTTEVAFCTFCGRPRTLRSEHHQLGALVRTIVTCETCHRTLSSSIAVAEVEAAPVEAAPPADPAGETTAATSPPVAAAKRAAPPTAKAKPKAKTTAAKPAASKSRADKKTR